MLAALLCFKVSKIVHCDLIQHAQLPVRVRWSIVVCQLHMFEAVWIGTLQRCKKYRRPTGNGLSGLRNQDRSSSVRLAYAVVSIGRESRYARTENTILRAASVTLLAVGVFFQHSKPGSNCGICEGGQRTDTQRATFMAREEALQPWPIVITKRHADLAITFWP